jgi:hypothetical protein
MELRYPALLLQVELLKVSLAGFIYRSPIRRYIGGTKLHLLIHTHVDNL